MKITSLSLLLISLLGLCNIELFNSEQMEETGFYALTATDIEGDDFSFEQLKGKKVLLVNTASECGLTPQYEQLQELHEQFGGESFIILGFPSNDFGAQEPGTETQIGAFCQKNYGVSFQMMSKVTVLGDDKHSVYKWLTEKQTNKTEDYEVKWNFHKFLVDENGIFAKEVSPEILPTDESIIYWIGAE